MSFTGFTGTDFDVFKINGLDARMDALKHHIRPKLEQLGLHFSPALTSLTGDEMFAHTAKHARRTKNAPNDTWVAFSNNPRGYKMLPHFQIGLWETHIFIWFAIIYEAPNKEAFGQNLVTNVEKIFKGIPKNFVWSTDHTKPEAQLHKEVTLEELAKMFERLQSVKKSEILCGFHIPRDQAVAMQPSEFVSKVGAINIY